MKNDKVFYYDSFDQDFVESKNQDYKLKDDFVWIHKNIFYRFFAHVLYLIFLLIAFVYTRLILKVKIVGKEKLKGYKDYYIYSNHTLMVGDILDPFIISFPKKPYIICSPANLGIPFIGKLLPIAGALPIPEAISKLKLFMQAVEYRHVVIIYPEAHQWPYCSFIRIFSESSFHFPVDSNKVSFTATTVFNKRKNKKKPKITIYINGPFKVDEKISRKENISKLHDDVYNSLVENSKKGDYEYYVYKPKEKKD